MLGFFLLTACAGCGRATYLERLDDTRRYFTYEDRLNQYLTRVAWAGKSFQLRVPNQFKPIERKAKAGENGEERDPRQPTFAPDLELPGLQGAWDASFSLTGGEGSGPGWLYLCSNYDFLAKKSDEAKAASFNADMIQRIAAAVGQNHEAAAVGKLTSHEVPPKAEEAFVDKRTYKMLNPGIKAIYDSKPYHVRIYDYSPKAKSPAQISLIYVLPDDIAQAATLDRAIDMSLETLLVTQEKPIPGAAKGTKGGKGKAAGGSF